MAGQDNKSSFTVGDFTQQFVGSTFDLSFTGAKLASSEAYAIAGIGTAANLTGGALLGVGVVVGAASDGLNGAVKGAVQGAFAIEGAATGAAAGFAIGGVPGSLIGTIVGGFGPI